MKRMAAEAGLALTARLEEGFMLYVQGRIGLGWVADLFLLEADASSKPEWTAFFACSRDMPLTPFCSKPEWMDRAGRRLMALRPNMNAVDAARTLVEHLWEEACDMSPEEAAEVYAAEHDE